MKMESDAIENNVAVCHVVLQCWEIRHVLCESYCEHSMLRKYLA